MVYFFILREENDVDERMKLGYYERQGYEIGQLKKAYDYNIKHNLPTTEIVQRLEELEVPVSFEPSMRSRVNNNK